MTGLTERYDLTIEWDVLKGPGAMRDALADAGFELVRERAEMKRWVARAAP